MITIWGLYKVGSSTIYNTLKENFPNIKVIKTHINIDHLKIADDLEYIIIPIRKDLNSLYISAYFQDILEEKYEYSPFNRCLNKFKKLDINEKKELIKIVDINILINDFKTINWEKYEWLNPNKALNILKNEFKFNFNLNELDEIKVIESTRIRDNKQIKLIFITTESISKELLIKLSTYLDIKYSESEFKYITSNIGYEKWYRMQYEKFKKSMV